MNSRVDCYAIMENGQLSGCDARDKMHGGNADNLADQDPRTGFYITTPIEERTVPNTQSAYQALGKINAAVSPEHQGQISFFVQPGSSSAGGIYGLPQATTFADRSLVSELVS